MTVKTAGVDLAEEEVDFLAEVDYSEAPEVAYSAVGGPVVAPEVDCLEADFEVVDLEEITTVKAARADLAEDEEEDFLAVVDYSEAPEVACLAVGDLALAQVVDCLEADLEAVDWEETTAVVVAGADSVEDKEVDFSVVVEALEVACLEVGDMAEVPVVEYLAGEIGSSGLGGGYGSGSSWGSSSGDGWKQ
ncbi:hypothetical protein MTO96_042283 [Rhipicephalus appendiculatus]